MLTADLKTGMLIELQAHSDSLWTRWRVVFVRRHTVAVERNTSAEEIRDLYGDAVTPVTTIRFIAVKRPDGSLTDDAGRKIEMREVR